MVDLENNMKNFDKRKGKKECGRRYYWWANYFNIKVDYKCLMCGKSCNGYFCSDKCKDKFIKENNIKKLADIKGRISATQSYIKNKPIWSNEWKRLIPLKDMNYHERINSYSYDLAITKLDKLSKLFIDLLKKTNVYKRFNKNC